VFRAIIREGQEPARVVSVGDPAAGGHVVRIQRDRMAVRRGDREEEVVLFKAAEVAKVRGAGGTAFVSVPARSGPGGRPPAPPPAPPPPPAPAPFVPVPQAPLAPAQPVANPPAGGLIGGPQPGLGFPDLGVISIPQPGPAGQSGYLVDGVRFFSPAMVAGVQKGDLITEVNGRPVATMTQQEVAEFLAGTRGSVSLTLERQGRPVQTTIRVP
jgi:membrane-associated protease RseP (regulator of RpoE activity)